MSEPKPELKPASSISLVWAQAANGVIGDRGRLPWRLPEDLDRFRELTLGATVLMGRRTWQSLPARARPLPGRRNVVLTRRAGWSDSGAEVAASLEQALQLAGAAVWVIGGAAVYRAALPVADRLVVTQLEDPYDGDVHAPALDDAWHLIGCDPAEGWRVSRAGLRYRMATYHRVRAQEA